MLKRAVKLRDLLFYGVMLFLPAAPLGCGFDPGKEIVEDSGLEKENNLQTAINYVVSELQKRGYTSERDINKDFYDPATDEVVGNDWEIHAYNSETGDEQYWEFSSNPAIIELSEDFESLGLTPDLVVVLENYFLNGVDYSALNSLIEKYCNN